MIKEVLLYSTLPGAGGGLAFFFYALRNGWLRNNKFLRKALLEIAGGLLVASFVAYPLAPLFAGSTPVVFISFAMGACWSGIMQILRRWITNYFGKFLNEGGE